MSTTGLCTVSVADSYTWFGEIAVLALIQLGGIGYMTVSSFVILARRSGLPAGRERVMRAQFSLPADFRLAAFIRALVVFTLVIELLGAVVLYFEFAANDVANPAWSAAFHSVSAFSTAGFSLNNNSLENFAGSVWVNGTIGVLCYAGGIGFIVLHDAWLCVRIRGRRLTFTTKVILCTTAGLLVVGTIPVFLQDPFLAELPFGQRLMAAAFQVTNASTTAGFNSVPISAMGDASLIILTLLMVIGASPAGTGGGMKTTTISALFAVVKGTLRGTGRVTYGRNEIPVERVHTAVSNFTLYLFTLAVGVYMLALAEGEMTLALAFEATSALGTVGLSMGETGALNDWGKLTITGLMFIGRVSPLTTGLSFVRRREVVEAPMRPGDLTV
jgi:trk system potassium uptake protein